MWSRRAQLVLRRGGAEEQVWRGGIPELGRPSLVVCGRFLVLAGEGESGEYEVWALEVGEEGVEGFASGWRGLEVEDRVRRGRWSCATLWRDTLLLVGERSGGEVEDTKVRPFLTSRSLSSTPTPQLPPRLATLDLPSHGIYRTPTPLLPPSLHALALSTLSLSPLSDFNLITTSGTRLSASRSLLSFRWPWFRLQLERFSDVSKELEWTRRGSSTPHPYSLAANQGTTMGSAVGCRALSMPFGTEVVYALLQYFYTLALETPLQRRLEILGQLLIFAEMDGTVPELRELVVFQLHEKLGNQEGCAEEARDVAVLCRCEGLRVVSRLRRVRGGG